MGRIPDIDTLEYGFTEKAELKAYNLGIEHERKRIIQTIRDTYAKDELEEHGAFVFTEDIVQLIEGKAPQY